MASIQIHFTITFKFHIPTEVYFLETRSPLGDPLIMASNETDLYRCCKTKACECTSKF